MGGGGGTGAERRRSLSVYVGLITGRGDRRAVRRDGCVIKKRRRGMCGCEGEIMTGQYKQQKVMKNASGWQEIQSFSGVWAPLRIRIA